MSIKNKNDVGLMQFFYIGEKESKAIKAISYFNDHFKNFQSYNDKGEVFFSFHVYFDSEENRKFLIGIELPGFDLFRDLETGLMKPIEKEEYILLREKILND